MSKMSTTKIQTGTKISVKIGGPVSSPDLSKTTTAVRQPSVKATQKKSHKLSSHTALELTANSIRQDIIKMLETAGSGHSAGPLGLADIVTALYFKLMKHNPDDPTWEERDILLLSNGHCVPVQYAAMAEAGYFHKSELATLRQFGSRLQGHPERVLLPGLENTSGPLGCGLSQACGMSLGMRLKDQNKRWIYVIMGDGEQDEGNVWEAAMFANRHKLGNIIAITDRNNIQIDGPTETVMPLEPLRAKWESFGWHVVDCDGNNIDDFLRAVGEAKAVTYQPTMILAHTVAGKGVDFMEYDFHWHGKPPKHDEAGVALKELRTLRGKIRSEHE